MTTSDKLQAARMAVDALLAKFNTSQPVTLIEVQQTRELIAEVYAGLPVVKAETLGASIDALDAIIADRLAEIATKQAKVA